MADARPPLRISVLISGSGSTLRNLLELCQAGRLHAQVVGVAASRECTGLAHAREFGVPYAVVPRGKPFDVEDFSARLSAQLDLWQPELIAFGGFLSLYSIPPQYTNKVINIHPALLPAFGGAGMYGDHVHEAVLASGTKVTGCSVHLVNNEYDAGAVLVQRAVPVMEGDTVATLGERVRATERELYPQVIQWFAEGRVSIGPDGAVAIAQRNF
jgi:formyltetrahydrofolate-dependent phosphoribosylglycinamide formyltransferase